ncbi:putative endonuclease [Hathewaya proteolytica DSM 3090]|uniref:Putative endonuclease n=1 Tax=Hathewaya proteolytica DSM 3090 TaxID=1121331 RepID=A0A1M6JLE6_9CLOT|nr:putative endonuclease [Hathewaya proteolytica DSM 3090]
MYIVECSDGTLYTGYTMDIEKRIKTHNAGKGAKYTRCRLPVTLKYSEQYDTKEEAMKRECSIKKLKREDKFKLFENKTHGQGQL